MGPKILPAIAAHEGQKLFDVLGHRRHRELQRFADGVVRHTPALQPPDLLDLLLHQARLAQLGAFALGPLDAGACARSAARAPA